MNEHLSTDKYLSSDEPEVFIGKVTVVTPEQEAMLRMASAHERMADAMEEIAKQPPKNTVNIGLAANMASLFAIRNLPKLPGSAAKYLAISGSTVAGLVAQGALCLISLGRLKNKEVTIDGKRIKK